MEALAKLGVVLIPFKSGHLVFLKDAIKLGGESVLIPFKSGHLVFPIAEAEAVADES